MGMSDCTHLVRVILYGSRMRLACFLGTDLVRILAYASPKTLRSCMAQCQNGVEGTISRSGGTQRHRRVMITTPVDPERPIVRPFEQARGFPTFRTLLDLSFDRVD